MTSKVQTQREKRKVVSWVLFTDNALEEMLTKAKAGHGTYELEVSSTFDPELDRTYAVVTRSDVISNPIYITEDAIKEVGKVGEDFDAKKAAEAYFASDSEEEEDLDTREELEEEDLDMESEFAEETERETSDDLETRAEREMEARDEQYSNFKADMADKAAEEYFPYKGAAYSSNNEDCSLCMEIRAQEAEGSSDSEIQAQREREIQAGQRQKCCGCRSARGRQECEDCDCHIDAYNEDKYERMAGQDYEPPTYDGPD